MATHVLFRTLSDTSAERQTPFHPQYLQLSGEKPPIDNITMTTVHCFTKAGKGNLRTNIKKMGKTED